MTHNNSALLGFQSDSGDEHGKDLLGIETDVAALASLMTARNILPPLSIGLFGGEGSGKSFFMRRLAERVDGIAADVDSMYCHGIVQVYYNAWHNAGTNPWIGFVEVIFTGLNQWSIKTERASEFDRMLSSIGTAQKLGKDLYSSLDRTRQLVDKASRQLEDAHYRKEEAMRHHAEHSSRSKWAGVQQQLSRRLTDQDRTEVDQAGQMLGFTELFHNSEQFEKALDEAKTLGGRANLMTSSLKAKRHLGNLALTLLGVLLIGFGIFLGPNH